MQNTDVFDSNAFRDFTAELDRLQNLRKSRPHYPDKFWHRALMSADRTHTARQLAQLYTLQDYDCYRTPTTNFVEKLSDHAIAQKMNGKPLKLASA
jgi:hypothetical protein